MIFTGRSNRFYLETVSGAMPSEFFVDIDFQRGALRSDWEPGSAFEILQHSLDGSSKVIVEMHGVRPAILLG